MGWKEWVSNVLGLEAKAAPAPAKGALPLVAVSNDGRPLSSEWSTGKAINEGLKSSTWVYTACRKVSTALASVRLVVERRNGEEWEPDPGHPLQALLDRPNPFMSRQDMLERWTLHLMLGGNALWHKVLVGGKPVEVWPLMPDAVKPIPSRAKFIGGYEWKNGSDKTILPAEVVLHWQFADPGNPYWGLAPLQAAAIAVDTDKAAVKWNRATLANDGRPPLAIFLDSELDATQQELAARFIQGQIDGNNVRKALVLGGASKAQTLGLNAAELDFLASRRFGREEIGAVFGVPPVLMVAGEATTFANLEAAKRILWEDTVVPLLDDFCQGVGMMLSHWGNEATHRVVPDLSGVTALQENLKTTAEVGKLRGETFKLYVDSGVPANMAALALGLPLVDIPGGDAPRSAAPAAVPQQAKGQRWTRTDYPGYPPDAVIQRKDKGEDEVAARLARMDAWIGEVQDKVAAILLEQGNTAASAYVAERPWESALDPDDWQDLLEAVHTAVIEAEGKVAYTAVLSSITAQGGGGVFDVLADGVVDWIQDHVGENVKGITETSKALLQGQITAGVEAGESVTEIAKRLRAANKDWAGWRAEVIARTETASAFGAAHAQAAQQLADEFDVEMVKTWVATKDKRTRDEHAAIDGETRALDEPFSIGVMQSPGGIQCRCVTTYAPKEG